MKLPYNPNDKNSILAYAKLLKGKTLRASCDKSIIEHILVLRPNLTYNVVKTLVEKTRLKRENHLLATKDIIDIFLIDDMIQYIHKLSIQFNIDKKI